VIFIDSKEIASRALSLMLSISASCGYDSYMMMASEEFMNGSVSLVLEIDDLLDNGYSKDEIRMLIEKCDFSKKMLLTEEETEDFRNYAYYLLNIRYNLYLDEKSGDKIKKKIN